MNLYIDIETYSECDLRAEGVYRYAAHPSTEVLCLCWVIDNGPVNVWAPDQSLDALCELMYREDVFVYAHNAAFERQVLTGRGLPVDGSRRMALPAVPICRWRCTMAEALAANLPASLDQACKALGLPGKDMQGANVMRQLMRPRKPTKNMPWTRWTRENAREKYQQLEAYCAQDVEIERALHSDPRVFGLTDYEWSVWAFSELVNDRGMRIDLGLVQTIVDISTRALIAYNGAMVAETGLNSTQVEKLTDWVSTELGEKVDALDAGTIRMMLDDASLDDRVASVLQLRQLAAKTSVKKAQAMLARTSADGRLRGGYRYWAAGPGRFGGQGVQPHNFPRASVDYDEAMRDIESGFVHLNNPLDTCSRLLRPCIVPAPGKKFVAADFSAVEAVGTGWIADDNFYMTAYRGDGKLYEQMASRVYSIPEDQVTEDQRFLGKTIILGCGFGMGLKKFISTARTQGSKEPTETLARAHAIYRDSALGVVSFWHQLNAAVKTVILKPGARRHLRGLEIGVARGVLYILLPSGRALAYQRPEVVMEYPPWEQPTPQKLPQITYYAVNEKTKQYCQTHTHGGKLTENVVQAIARDLLVNAMFLVNGYTENCRRVFDVVLHSHDELVSETDADRAESRFAKYVELACEIPAWAAGFPLRAKGKVLDRYRKI